MNLLSKVKKFPPTSGVYIFKDKKKNVLYIGRAISLRRRVLNYFQKNLSDSRIKEMVNLIYDIEYQKTDSLLEAIILEANLIKKYWPKYNIKERDNRSFLYIVFTKAEYPRPLIIREREFQKFPVSEAYIFGPYQSLSLVKNFLKIIRRIFPYSTCKPFSGRPCFDYQIGLCPGLCIGRISKEDYQKNIKNIILLLSGKKKKLLKQLKKDNFEIVRALNHIQETSLLIEDKFKTKNGKIQRIEGYDISHFAGKEPYGAMVVFENNKPSKSNYRLFKIKTASAKDDLRALEEIIFRRFNHLDWQIPDLILIDGGRPQVNYIFKILKNRHINIPLVGISKQANDKFVFPPKMKKSIKELIKNIKETLLKVRNEAHRFAIRAHRRKRKLTPFVL